MGIEALLGKTLTKIEGAAPDSGEILFTTADGRRFSMYHEQDCCECVRVESVVGDVADLIGEPIVRAEEATSDKDPPDSGVDRSYRESFTWTFYKLATRKGYVDIRWYGESNGYYSERVEFVEL